MQVASLTITVMKDRDKRRSDDEKMRVCEKYTRVKLEQRGTRDASRNKVSGSLCVHSQEDHALLKTLHQRGG